jgi:chromosome partitioning protein
LTQLTNTFQLVKNNLNPGLTIQGVILTMADFRTNLTKEVINEVKNNFSGRVYDTVIPRSIRLSEAPSYGKPIAIYDKDNIGAKKYEELTQEILGAETVSRQKENDTVMPATQSQEA